LRLDPLRDLEEQPILTVTAIGQNVGGLAYADRLLTQPSEIFM